MVSDKAKPVEVEEAFPRLVVIPDYEMGSKEPEPCVHSFRIGSGMCLGAHWTLDQVEASAQEHGVKELSEAIMGHGLLIVDDTGPVVFESVDLA